MSKNFFYALSTLIGMIVGVGIFGIPFVIAQAGFLTGFFYLILLTGAILLIHLFYGEIVLRTQGQHRLVGYAEKYLGSWGKKITGLIIIFEFYGALLAYLIVGGHFLNIVLGRFLGGSDFSWMLTFFVFGSLAILLGLRTVGFLEGVMMLFLLAAAGILIFKGVPFINFANLKTISWANSFLPYGVIFFALTGGAAIPEMRQILGKESQKLKKAIIWGTAIPALIYFLFALTIVGVTGQKTTKDAISGLISYLGQNIVILGAIFGFLAVITSFLVLGLNLRRVFQFDYKLNSILAWALACFVPLIGYFIGLRDFITVIGLVGAVAGGLEGIMVVFIYLKAKIKGERQPEYSLKINKVFIYGLILLFVLGMLYELIYFVR